MAPSYSLPPFQGGTSKERPETRKSCKLAFRPSLQEWQRTDRDLWGFDTTSLVSFARSAVLFSRGPQVFQLHRVVGGGRRWFCTCNLMPQMQLCALDHHLHGLVPNGPRSDRRGPLV
uniref:Uncharacterized protein n=1 Tax=Micrurus corallinus TaxID=54390 RepID=A0A2D4GTV3_MICCO